MTVNKVWETLCQDLKRLPTSLNEAKSSDNLYRNCKFDSCTVHNARHYVSFIVPKAICPPFDAEMAGKSIMKIKPSVEHESKWVF